MLNFDTLRVAILCSKRAPGLDALLRHPHRGALFDIVTVMTSEPFLAEQPRIEQADVPVLVHPIRRFHDQCNAPLRDGDCRRAYDAMTVRVLEQLGIDTIVMLGYCYVASEVLLSAFPDRVLNMHDSDLTLVDGYGERRYIGLHSTLDAILAGERETRSTLHLVTPKLDGGPIVERSKAYPVAEFARDAAAAGHLDIVKAYAYAQREWMMRDAWGTMVVRALEAMSAGIEVVA